ncbi:MAG: glycosyltransferase [Salinispira sp.]
MYVRGIQKQSINIGFISTRFQGTDGVSLETEKWVSVLSNMGFSCYFFAGLSDWNTEKTMVVPEAFWEHPKIAEIQSKVFGTKNRSEELTGKIHCMRKLLKSHIYTFIKKFSIDVLIIENALAIPMNIPLALAITEIIAESDMPAIAHHHDFFWERIRFLVNNIPDYIAMAFPPQISNMAHVVINSEAQQSLSYRTGLSSVVVPNVHDYHAPVTGIDEYNKDFRRAIGIAEDDILFLQPTRIVARKGIEHAVELLHRLKNPKAKLLISHQTKDEGQDYYERIISYAKLLEIDLLVCPDIIGAERGRNEKGQKVYSLWDIYPHADFVTYPSSYEGFGNAFLETIYFRKPLMVNRYSIFVQDIEPLGFDAIIMDSYITEDVVNRVRNILRDPETACKMTDKNFDLAKQYFSYEILEQKLRSVLLGFGIVDNMQDE